MQLLLPILSAALLASNVAQAAISILEPNSAITWHTNDTVTVKWSSAPDDPSPFRIILSNPDQNLLSGNASIADSVPTNNAAVTILLPGLNFGDDYRIFFINPKNTTEVYAESQPFSIDGGNRTTTSGVGSATRSSTPTNIPGPVQTIPNSKTTSSSASASPTASPASGARGASFGYGTEAIVGAMGVVVGVGALMM
jgi:hypothetical protein